MSPWQLFKRDYGDHITYIVYSARKDASGDDRYMGRVRRDSNRNRWVALVPGLVEIGTFPTRREAIEALYARWRNDPNNLSAPVCQPVN